MDKQCANCINYKVSLTTEPKCSKNNICFVIHNGARACDDYKLQEPKCDVFYVDDNGIPQYEYVDKE